MEKERKKFHGKQSIKLLNDLVQMQIAKNVDFVILTFSIVQQIFQRSKTISINY